MLNFFGRFAAKRFLKRLKKLKCFGRFAAKKIVKKTLQTRKIVHPQTQTFSANSKIRLFPRDYSVCWAGPRPRCGWPLDLRPRSK